MPEPPIAVRAKVRRSGRGESVARVLRLLERLRAGRCRLPELATYLAVTTRTVRRDLDVISELSVDYGWTLEHHTVDEGRGRGYAVWWLA